MATAVNIVAQEEWSLNALNSVLFALLLNLDTRDLVVEEGQRG
jgi:hypothetical protein